MLRDEVRTGTYRNAILQNTNLFRDKIVGCGTGILCMFAAEAGASKVIGIDCAHIIDRTRNIVSKNGFADVITLIKCKVEDAKLPGGIDKVDIIISEWMGYCLLFETFINSILFARDKWLKKECGLIFPDKFWLYLTAFEDKRFIQDKESSITIQYIFYLVWDNVQGYDMSSIIRHQDFDRMFVDVINAAKVVSNSSLIKRDLDVEVKVRKDTDSELLLKKDFAFLPS
ncbi:protein arginine N-methyltransferase 1-B-like [Mytilus trossulus]|uniref:protein arginine N-methyltransferase 1-B-like n=1 Tax=Mytilus trossulus TaxID=6551 RepID=UPI003006BD60